MRGAGIGLLGLLVVMAIIFYVSYGNLGKGAPNGYVGHVLEKGKEAREQGNQIAGRDAEGVPVSESIKTDEVDVGGQFKRIKVVSLVPGGAFDTAYHLQPNDEVSEIGGLGVDMNNDYGLAQARLFEAIQRNEPLTVVRGGQKLTLTPDTALSKYHPELFGKPGTAGGISIPTH